MNPRVETVKDSNGKLTFKLAGVNVSLANAVRRTVLSDIPTTVFITAPHDKCMANFITNTTRLNNEILKQRLSCVPIHINDLDMPLKNYLVEVDVENLTDTVQYVTTQDFKVRNLTTGEFLSEKDNSAIFPPNELTGYYIDFARLRPKLSQDIPGEKLKFTAEMSIGTSKEDGMFNVASMCSYGFTVDDEQQTKELAKKTQKWRDSGLNKTEIDMETKNWKLLEGQRVIKNDSYDFGVETIGVYTNAELVRKACNILIKKLEGINSLLDKDELAITTSTNTMKNCYDIILENEDYTIGKVIEYTLYAKFYEELKTMSFCGFKKLHPHDSDSIIRVAYHDVVDKADVKQNIELGVNAAIAVFSAIRDKF